jgi:carboxynorspermidine decarboxylase
MYATFPLIRKTLDGTCASSVNEARLGREKFGKEVHVYGAAYSDKDFRELLKYADHIDFNSFAQWKRFKPLALKHRNKSFGIRVNPEHSEGTVPIYDPGAPNSRLGTIRSEFRPDELDGISYLHFHNLCQQNADALARTVKAVEEKFGEFIPKMKYVNFGGGHHITRGDYDMGLLCTTINDFKKKYSVQVYLEPGEAVALNAGYLVATVLDIVKNGVEIAVLDTSAAAHMPDVLEMPYRPFVIGSGKTGEKAHNYRLAGMSCLAGDVMGDYSFDEPLKTGDKLVFTDMAIYSMVKTNTFNGLNLPSIGVMDSVKGTFRVLKKFGYRDFAGRL